jgi:hypothetical protein
MRPLFIILLLCTLLASCSKDNNIKNNFIKSPSENEYTQDHWEITKGASDANNLVKRAFIKDDLLYIVSNEAYKVIDKSNRVIKTVAFDTAMIYYDFAVRFNDEYIIVSDPLHIMIKHLQSGIEKYININPSSMGKFRINGGEHATIFLSSSNNLYYNLDKRVSGSSNFTNYGSNIRFDNNKIFIDSIAPLTNYINFLATGSRYQMIYGTLYDDLTTTYTNLNLTTIPTTIPIQEEANGNAHFITYTGNGGDIYYYLTQYSNGVLTETKIDNETQYANSIASYYLSGNTLYFSTGYYYYYYGLVAYDLTNKTFKTLKQDNRLERIQEIIEYNERLYLITTSGVLSKPLKELNHN